MKLEIELDDSDIKALIREKWYGKIRKITEKTLKEEMFGKVEEFLKENNQEFKDMFRLALVSVLKQFTIRDLSQIAKVLNVKLEGEKK